MTSHIEQNLTWVVEPLAFPPRYAEFSDTIARLGHELIIWDEDCSASNPPKPSHDNVVFHGSLGVAELIRRELEWRPGVYCRTESFGCTRWYPRAEPWRLVRRYVNTTVQQFVDAPQALAGHLASDGRVFVRPDSPLKPFSGRVVSLDGLSFADLDLGFYYDDPTTPILVAEVVQVDQEWRFVVVNREPVAASGYEADGRTAQIANDAPWDHAKRIAAAFEPPENVYVLDLCSSGGDIRIVELNPFSGADLYACDAEAVITAVSSEAQR